MPWCKALVEPDFTVEHSGRVRCSGEQNDFGEAVSE
jgi:hypothetical protein